MCLTLPLYYLFNIPDKALSDLGASKNRTQNEKELIDKTKGFINELDLHLAETKFGKEYDYYVLELYKYFRDNLDESHPYYFIMNKTVDLYESIAKVYIEGGKSEIERLKLDISAKDAEILRLSNEISREKLTQLVEINKLENEIKDLKNELLRRY